MKFSGRREAHWNELIRYQETGDQSSSSLDRWRAGSPSMRVWRSRAGPVSGVGNRDSPSARILSALASEMPLIVVRTFLGVKATLSTVLRVK